MNNILDFLSDYVWIYLWLILMTFVNIIAPISGSSVINPVTAFFTDPQRAIGISAFVFFFTGMHRVYLFRRQILSEPNNLRIIKRMVPFSILGAILGATFISLLNARILAIIVVLASLYFIVRTITKIKKESPMNPSHHKGVSLMAFASGFLQGGGMPGSDMRNNYLRGMVSEVSVRAVGSATSFLVFFATGTVIFLNQKLTHNDLIFVITVVPPLLLAQIYGKKFLDKMSDKNAKLVAIALSLLGIILLSQKYIF